MEYKLRFANKGDSNKIMEYIDKYWRKGHILSRDEGLFHWQYDGESDRLNFVIGIDSDNSIQGILGFIPYGNNADKDIALALWKSNPSAGIMGLELLQFLIQNEPHREIICTGINIATTGRIYKFFGMQVKQMSHWYRLAPRVSYSVALIKDNRIPAIESNREKENTIDFVEVQEFRQTANLNGMYSYGVPKKSITYLEHRYVKHPIYQYLIYALKRNSVTEAYFVFRIQKCNHARVLRMIDCIGNETQFESITLFLDSLLEKYHCEYVDLYQTGLDEAMLLSGGWLSADHGDNIIPDYFSPFELRNVDIYCATSNSSSILFKGDGDQDRPN